MTNQKAAALLKDIGNIAQRLVDITSKIKYSFENGEPPSRYQIGLLVNSLLKIRDFELEYGTELRDHYNHNHNQKLGDSMSTLHIMRGLPGSGKSTHIQNHIVKHLPNDHYVICSADDYFYQPDGTWAYNSRFIARAHEACKAKCIKAMTNDTRIIVIDNTNCQHWEYALYLELAKHFRYNVYEQVISPETHTDGQLYKQCVHNVPIEVITRMRAEWEA